ncbi:MAG: ligase-associated DNA damage response endonuclease PdeM [Gelidibacter sp.]
MVTKEIVCRNEILTLTNQRALFWKRENMLVLSDLHIGKTAHFRKAGIAIPSQILQNDLKRLELLIENFDVETVLFVGDLFHAEINKDMDEFINWKQKFNNIKFELIKGNHDRLKDSFYQTLEISTFKTHKDMLPFRFVHDANHCNDQTFCISGHTHPGVVIYGRNKTRIKLPCFELSENQLVLPAFSEFTGLNTKRSFETSVCYGFTESSLFEL